MLADNSFMLERFSSADEINYYNTCKDIMLAGKDYKVLDIKYFIKDLALPLADYVSVKTYDDEDGFVLVYACTSDPELIREAAEYVHNSFRNVKTIELRSVSDIFGCEALTSLFYVVPPEDECISPVYVMHTRDELLSPDEDSSVSIRLADDTDRADVQEELKNGGLDEYFKEGMFFEYSFHKDTKVFIMRVNGRIAGYLRAENGYSNIYDIGWIYVLPEYRGHSYGAYMVSFFTEYLFNMGCIPQYGFAINPESAKIAEKCGYKCSDERNKLTAMCLKHKEAPV